MTRPDHAKTSPIVTHGSDFVTISWTKFSYSGKRSGGHQFSNLIGHSDSNSSEDSGHLRVSFHHNWWGANVGERMPRARFGQIHAFNNLFTSAGDNYCIRAGVSAKILTENNVFQGVKDPFDIAGGSVVSKGNLFTKVSGRTTGSGTAFTAPYAYTLASTSGLASAIMSGAGVH
jgi:pectate lyase